MSWCITGVVQRVLDVRDGEGIKVLARDFPDIDVLFNCAGSLRGIDRRCVYGATKAAVIGLTKGLAMEHVRDGISPSFSSRSADPEDSDLEHITFMENKRIGRLAKPEEVANLCVYLASDESSYHTGNVFVIDGGFTL
ncbi:3-hydroxybutyrate dehydrogenase type 2 [Portunus trituberculatus]|uniref:Dehydrogenase/reductase SDR family member 6 n=1 Tax=Portunus trituberculatus TaxID=210409 RepID=A0A5B7HD14_PORTR|nr:3-hydroxybutyrate dehydrogenase type 2 [Portunus trituberculatus]